MPDKTDFSIEILRELKDLLPQVRKIVDENANILSRTELDEKIYTIYNKTTHNKFFFSIETAKSGIFNILFTIKFKPESIGSISSTLYKDGISVSKNGVLKYLNIWIELIKEYDQIDLTEEAEIDAAAEKEIYELFDFTDKDADTSAFNLNQQLFLDNALTNVEDILGNNQSEHDVATIIEEIKNLRKSIPTATKKTIGKRLSKIFVATKKHSIPLFKEVIKEFLKDSVKWGIETGFHRMIEYFH